MLSILLSDVLGDPPDMIASDPAYPDFTTCAQAMEIVRRYDLRLFDDARRCLSMETPKRLSNVETVFLTDRLSCEAREAEAFLSAVARSQAGRGRKAFILGSETVVHLTGDGLGGRNQELALSAARGMDGLTARCCSPWAPTAPTAPPTPPAVVWTAVPPPLSGKRE